MKEFEEFFKKNRKTPPDYAWANILAGIELKEKQSSYSKSFGKSKVKSRLIFAFSFLILFALSSFFVYLRFIKTSSKAYLPQKAIVISVSGKAEIETSDGDIIKIRKGIDVTNAYVVRTRNKSKLTIGLSGGSVVALSDNTELKISSLLKKKGRVERTSIDLYRGGIVAEPRRIEQGGSFNVNTPTAVAGVRGTKFYVGYNNEAEATRVAVERGRVYVTRKIPLEVSKGVKAKIVKAIGAYNKVDRGQSVYITRSENERIGEEVGRQIDDIQRHVASNQGIEDINAVQKAKAFSAIKVSALTGAEASLFALGEASSAKVKVVIPSMGGKLYVNGKRIAANTFASEFDAGQTIRVRILKNGYKNYDSVFRVPQGSAEYTPDIILERQIKPRQRVEEIPSPQQVIITPAPQLPEAPVVPELKIKEITLPRVYKKQVLKVKPYRNPVIYDGSIYYYSSSNEFVSQSISSPSAPAWKVKTDAMIDALPAFDNDTVYIADRSAYLYAINRQTGRIIWKKKYGTILFNSKIILKSSRLYFGTSEGYVFALNKKTGAVVWKYEVGAGIWASVAVSSDAVYTGCEDRYVYAINRDSGDLIWKKRLERRIISAPVVEDKRLYISDYSGKAYSLNLKDGSIYWSKRIGKDISGFAVRSGKLFIARGNTLYSYDAFTAEKLNSVTLEGIKGFAIYNNAIFALHSANVISELSFNLDAVWKHSFGAKIIGKPLFVSGRPAVVSRNADVFFLNRIIKKTVIIRN